MATTDSESGGGDDRLPAAVIEDLLSSSRRRALLEWLHGEESIPVDDLAIRLAARTGSGERVTASERRAARTEIYQEHLPKLTATGVVTFDSLLGRVELNDVPALTARLGSTTERGTTGEDGTKDK